MTSLSGHGDIIKKDQEIIAPLRQARELILKEIELAKSKKEMKVYSSLLKKLKDIENEIDAFHEVLGIRPKGGSKHN